MAPETYREWFNALETVRWMPSGRDISTADIRRAALAAVAMPGGLSAKVTAASVVLERGIGPPDDVWPI